MSASTITALGIDVGSTTAKIVGVDAAGALVWHHMEPTEPRIEEQAERFLQLARGAHSAPPAAPLVATGYGRALVRGASRALTEIGCHARGVFRDLGHGGTLIDIGGQDTKVIEIGPGGNVLNFAMNDKCAAGTGRFLEVTATRLLLALDQMGPAALSADEEVSISSTCTVFAESEIVSLIARGTPVPHIVRGLFRSLCRRVSALARSTGLTPPLMLSGGVAQSIAVRTLLQEELRSPIQVPDRPQLMGAYGAALSALSYLGQPPSSGQSGI